MRRGALFMGQVELAYRGQGLAPRERDRGGGQSGDGGGERGEGWGERAEA